MRHCLQSISSIITVFASITRQPLLRAVFVENEALVSLGPGAPPTPAQSLHAVRVRPASAGANALQEIQRIM